MPRSKPPRNALRKLLAAAVGLMLLVTAAPHTAFAAYRNFPDVGPNDWYVVSGDFDYALDQGIFSGYENGNFGPAENVTRGMAATILWRIAGEPAAEAEPFLDVNYDAFYGDAITWARATGVISGYENGTFGPNGAVTREQLATMLANYASKIAKITITTDHTKLNVISGANQVSVWAYDALGWCVDNGILSGMNTAQGRQLQPQGTASRGQASKMFSVLHRDILDLGDSEGTGINVVDIPGVDVADYRDNAVLIDGAEAQVNQDSNQATVPADEADEVEAGDIVVVDPKDLENGIALKVTSVTKRGDDAVIKGTTPKPEEVFDKLEMEGETTITADDIELAQGVELVDGDVEQLASSEIDPQAIDGEVDFNTIKLKVEASKPLKDEFGNNVSLGGSITFKLRPVLSYSVDFNVFRLSKSYALVDLSLDPSVEISGDFDVEGKFQLFSTGTIPAFGVYFVVEADGSISLESDMPQLGISFGVGDCDRISEPKTDQTGTTWEMSGGISGKLGFLAEVSLDLLNFRFFDAGVELGGKGEYQETPRTPDFTCEDVNFWFYVSEHITGHALWSGSFEHSLFDKKNSPLKALNHYENGELVPKCTWDPNKPGESDEPGDPSGETEASQFIYTVGDYLLDGNVGSGSLKQVLEQKYPASVYDLYYKQVGSEVRWNYSEKTSGGVANPSFGGTGSSGGGIQRAYDCGHGVYITGYKGSTSGTITIPKQIGGVDVVYVGIRPDAGGRYIHTLDLSHATQLRAFEAGAGSEMHVEFGSLPRLENIASDMCTFTGAFDSRGCPNVKTLTFSDGTHFDTSLDFATGNLEEFSLAMSNIWGTFTFDAAPKLREILIAQTPIETLVFNGSFPSLESLTIEGTNISQLTVSGFPKLSYLWVANNKISDVSSLQSWLNQPGHEGAVFVGEPVYSAA